MLWECVRGYVRVELGYGSKVGMKGASLSLGMVWEYESMCVSVGM